MDFRKTLRASRIEAFAVGGAVAALGAMLIGQAAQQYAENGDLPPFAMARLASPIVGASHAGGLDYSPTGSIKFQSVILDPCTGQQKSRQ